MLSKKRKVTKEDILQGVTPLEIFSFYLGKNIRLGKTYRSPLRDDSNFDKHPSFNVYKSPKGGYYYKDFAVDRGDCFDFVMRLHNISFNEAITRIARDMNIFPDLGTNTSALNFTRKKAVEFQSEEEVKTKFDFEYLYDHKKMTMTEEEHLLEYYGQFGIDANAIYHYPVRVVRSVSFTSKDNNRIVLTHSDDNPIFMYDYGIEKRHHRHIVRFYRPKAKKKREIKYVGNTGAESIFGITNIELAEIRKSYERTGTKTVCICAGQKDTMAVFSVFGIYAICLSSESSFLTAEQFLMLKEIFGDDCRFISLYDNDKCGDKYSAILEENYSIAAKKMSVINKQHNDISEYINWVLLNPVESFRIMSIQYTKDYLLL